MLILHGDDIIASRNQLQKTISEAKLKNQEIVKIDGKKCTLTDIKQSLESLSLFGQSKLITIENLFSRPDSNEKKTILSYLSESVKLRYFDTSKLTLWEPKPLTPAQLKPFPKNEIQEFKLPTIIFQFLDTFSPHTPGQTLKLLGQALETQPHEMLFGMIVKRLRYLIVANANPNTLNQFKELRDWQQRKIITQSLQFTKVQLLKLNQKLLETDYTLKTGRTNLDLKAHLELILTNL